MVEGIDNAGTPDTPEGAEAARLVSDWSDSALDDLEEAQDSLDEEADSLEESITQLADAARAIGAALAAAYRRSRTSRARSRARASVAGVEHVSAASGGDELGEHDGLILVAVQGLVVIGFIALGVRSGGIGLGLWGGVGTLVLVFLFGLDPGSRRSAPS